MAFSFARRAGLATVFATLAASTFAEDAPDKKPPAGELRVRTDFEGGSGDVRGIDQRTRAVRIVPTNHPGRGWVCWWCVRVEGIRPGETLTLDVGGGVWATPDQGFYSLDQRTWKQLPPGERINDHILYRAKIDADAAWFAWGPPYTVGEARRQIDRVAEKHRFAQPFNLAQSLDGRETPGVRISEAADRPERLGIWVQARQHAWETGSSWVCQGFLEWLVSDDERAGALRGKALVTVVPVMDVDNVFRGAGGKNQTPHDHNRDWGDEPHFPAVAAAQQALRAAAADGRLDFFIDLHNPGAGDKQPFFFITPRKLLTAEQARNTDWFLAAAKAELNGPLKFEGMVRESGENYDRRWEYISKNWVSRATTPHVVSLTLETSWNTPRSTQENYRQIGRELGLAIERYLRQPVRQPAK